MSGVKIESRVVLWLVTLLMPYMIAFDWRYILAPIWMYPMYSAVAQFWMFLIGLPSILATISIEMLARGKARPRTVRFFIALGLATVLVIVLPSIYLGTAYYIPTPLAVVVQYILLRRLEQAGFSGHIEETPKAIPTLEEVVHEPEPIVKETEPSVEIPQVPIETSPEVIEEGVQVLRGCAAVGGTFQYKTKIQNNSRFVINRISVSIASYPEDCMELTGDSTKKISLIEPGGFRSPLFTFTPTKDCVQGQIQATVTYLDMENELQMIRVEPYLIRSVCDLLEPLESSLEEFETLLSDMAANSEEISLEKSPDRAYSEVVAFLPERNFELISTESGTEEGRFRGSVRALAEGKYTRKKVAVRIVVSGLTTSENTRALVETLGDDPDMLPTTIEEIVEGLKGVVA